MPWSFSLEIQRWNVLQNLQNIQKSIQERLTSGIKQFVWSFDRKKSQKGYVADIFNDQWLTMALMGGWDMDGI